MVCIQPQNNISFRKCNAPSITEQIMWRRDKNSIKSLWRGYNAGQILEQTEQASGQFNWASKFLIDQNMDLLLDRSCLPKVSSSSISLLTVTRSGYRCCQNRDIPRCCYWMLILDKYLLEALSLSKWRL